MVIRKLSLLLMLYFCPVTAWSMTFTNGWIGGAGGYAVIQAKGPIEPDSSHELEALIRYMIDNYGNPVTGSNDYLITILFYSSGGNLDAALALGHVVRKYKLHTNVGELINRVSDGKKPLSYSYDDSIAPASCIGACIYAYLGGVDRFIDNSPDAPFILTPMPNLNSEKMGRYLREMGVSHKLLFLQKMIAAPTALFPMQIRDWKIRTVPY